MAPTSESDHEMATPSANNDHISNELEADLIHPETREQRPREETEEASHPALESAHALPAEEVSTSTFTALLPPLMELQPPQPRDVLVNQSPQQRCVEEAPSGANCFMPYNPSQVLPRLTSLGSGHAANDNPGYKDAADTNAEGEGSECPAVIDLILSLLSSHAVDSREPLAQETASDWCTSTAEVAPLKRPASSLTLDTRPAKERRLSSTDVLLVRAAEAAAPVTSAADQALDSHKSQHVSTEPSGLENQSGPPSPPITPPKSPPRPAPERKGSANAMKDVKEMAYLHLLSEELNSIRRKPIYTKAEVVKVRKVLIDGTIGYVRCRPDKPIGAVARHGKRRGASGTQSDPVLIDEAEIPANTQGDAARAQKQPHVIIELPLSPMLDARPTRTAAPSPSPSSSPSPPSSGGRRPTQYTSTQLAATQEPGFYSLSSDNPALLRYQDASADLDVVPGTLLPNGRQPTRLKMAEFHADVTPITTQTGRITRSRTAASKFHAREVAVHPKQTTLHGSRFWSEWLAAGRPEDGAVEAVQDPFWAAARQQWVVEAPTQAIGGPALLQGFPLVEMVAFLRADNRRDLGNCYWNALAMHLYGRLDFGPRVKAEHLRFVKAVLATKQHPRHALYTDLNARFFQTRAQGVKDGRFVANMWQILHLPKTWTPSWMTQVTADLYGLFVVLYSLESGKDGEGLVVTETTVRGSYSSRHIFLLFVDQNHYQPMIPNEYDPSEFRCPRPTKDRTRVYKFGDSHRWSDGVGHAWRCESWCSDHRAVPMPLPVDHNMGSTLAEIDNFITDVFIGES